MSRQSRGHRAAAGASALCRDRRGALRPGVEGADGTRAVVENLVAKNVLDRFGDVISFRRAALLLAVSV